MSTSAPSLAALAREWDELRAAFASSILVDTPLSSLAQNLDGLDWPIGGPEQTPAAYIDFTYEELLRELTLRGHPAAPGLLLQILRETLAFDQPFGEMVEQGAAAAERDQPVLRSLARLGIPEAFPLELTLLDDTARELCRLEQAWTLGAFAVLAQKLSISVIVGGDFRRLLNALVERDERTLATLLPFRPGATGLHLAECLAQAARSQRPAEHAARAAVWFELELAGWRQGAAHDRRFVRRQLAVLNDERLESRALALLAPHLAARTAATPPSLWTRLKRWLHPSPVASPP